MAVLFLSQGAATPSEILGCEIIGLLNELLFCHLADSECSVVNPGAEIHQCIPKPSPVVTGSGVEARLGAKQGLNPATLTNSGS